MVVSEEAGRIDPWKKENVDLPSFLSQVSMVNGGTSLDKMIEFMPLPQCIGSDESVIFPILEEY